jgi:predicted permease
LIQDVRYGLRQMVRNPGFAVVAVLSLALGIGANTAIFSFMEAILLRPLPVPHPETLVVMNWHSKDHPLVVRRESLTYFGDPKAGFVGFNFPYPAFELLRASNSVCSTVFGFSRAGRVNVVWKGQADTADGAYVTGDFFAGMGVPPAAGRLLDATDDVAGAPAAAVVSYRYALSHFGSVVSALGETLAIDNKSFTVSGVTPAGFFGVNPQEEADVYLPMHSVKEIAGMYTDPQFYWIQAMARLRPGVTKERAEATLVPMFQQFVESTVSNAEERADLPVLSLEEGAGGLDFLRRAYSKPLWVLMAMVGLVLLIACANLANLLLARAARRQREIAVRVSLGAGRWRVARQLLTESVLLSTAGGTLGVVFAAWGISALTALLSGGPNGFTSHAELNWVVLGATAALSMVTGLLFGLAPAVQATRFDVASSGITRALKESTGGVRRRTFLRISLSQALVASQIALLVLILAGAGVFVHTLSNLHSVNAGFNPQGVLLFTVDAGRAGRAETELPRLYADLQTRFAVIPGVRSATLSDLRLLSGTAYVKRMAVPNSPAGGTDTLTMSVGPSFFETMQIPILLGRTIGAKDADGPPVAVVNESFVKKYLAGENPVGRHFQVGQKNSMKDTEIVGVSKDALYSSLKRRVTPTVYLPYGQQVGNRNQVTYELRTAGDPLSYVSAVRQIVREADSRIPLTDIRTQAAQMEQTLTNEIVFAKLCSAFAILALAIASIGLYGTMAYTVARRTNEIGIRMALGAKRGRVMGMVLREVAMLAAAGLAIGLPAAFATSKYLASFLFQLKPNDPVSIAGAVGILVAAAMAAGYVPARRASRIDPMGALRHE